MRHQGGPLTTITVSFLRGNVDAEADTYREEVMQRPREGTM